MPMIVGAADAAIKHESQRGERKTASGFLSHHFHPRNSPDLVQASFKAGDFFRQLVDQSLQ